MIILSSKYGEIFGVDESMYFIIVGVGLLAFAGFAYWVSNQKNVNQQLVKVVTGLDIAWVVGSIVVVATNCFSFSASGLMITSMVAVIIALFAFMQHSGLKAYISHLPEGRRSS